MTDFRVPYPLSDVEKAEYIVLSFRVDPEEEDNLSGYMLTHFSLGGIEERDDGEVWFYIPESEWNADAGSGIKRLTESGGINFSNVIKFDSSRNWNAEWEAGIEPQFVTESLVISPSWKLEEVVGSREHVILIDPKMSFGTGHHETTRLCLRALESLNLPGATVLDLGTGSGILGIYALMLGADHVLGIDTDEWAVENVQENLDLNRITNERFEIVRGTLASSVKAEHRFDIVIANIHRNVLIELAPALRYHVESGGKLLLSGLLTLDAKEVTTVYEKTGFKKLDTLVENDWSALLFVN